MSDIIKDAKRLLDGATPGTWFVESGSFGAVYSVGPISPGFEPGSGLDCEQEDADLAAAAPELAQALAEETWEYTYHIKRQGEWEPTRNMETHREDWWDDRLEVVETVGLLRASGFEARIVRRRVSPVEVINE